MPAGTPVREGGGSYWKCRAARWIVESGREGAHSGGGVGVPAALGAMQAGGEAPAAVLHASRMVDLRA